ncbi:MAG: DUF5723 family protein [Owenweeksia sp.]
MKNWIQTLAFVFITVAASAQSDLTLYNFNAIPQSLHTNPAYPQQTKVWVGLPVISGMHVHFHNNGFKLVDLLATGTDVNENLDNIINNLDDKSHLAVRNNLDLLGVAFQMGNGFFSMGATQTVDFRMDYPVDLLKLVRFGNDQYVGQSLNVNQFDYETMVRTNIYLGYQHSMMDDRLRIGGRFKYIIGQQHSYVDRMNAEINTRDEGFELDIKTDIRIRTAGVTSILDNTFGDNIMDNVIPANSGFAGDLGVFYKINDKWDVSASVIDLGVIKWSANTRDYISKGEYTYDGIDADLSNDNLDQSLQETRDSLKAAFDFKEVDGESYSRWLSSRVFLGANYHFNDKHALGALYHARLWNGEAFHDVSFNYQGRWSRMFQFIASYSVINGTYNNVGAGFDLKLGPIQLYVLSDNVLGALMYENLQTTNLRFGVNFTFYGKKGTNATQLVDPIPAAPAEIPEPIDNN